MALDNVQLVEFCNADLRVVADRVSQLLTRTEAAYATYLARDLGTVINDGGSANPVLDGSATDGRTICTGGDVFNFVTLLQDFNAFMTSGRREVMAKWQVNGDR
jgi:hypothetical protein